MELTRGRVLLPPVVASVEIPYDIKEESRVGIRGQRPLAKFFRPRPLNIREIAFCI